MSSKPDGGKTTKKQVKVSKMEVPSKGAPRDVCLHGRRGSSNEEQLIQRALRELSSSTSVEAQQIGQLSELLLNAMQPFEEGVAPRRFKCRDCGMDHDEVLNSFSKPRLEKLRQLVTGVTVNTGAMGHIDTSNKHVKHAIDEAQRDLVAVFDAAAQASGCGNMFCGVCGDCVESDEFEDSDYVYSDYDESDEVATVHFAPPTAPPAVKVQRITRTSAELTWDYCESVSIRPVCNSPGHRTYEFRPVLEQEGQGLFFYQVNNLLPGWSYEAKVVGSRMLNLETIRTFKCKGKVPSGHVEHPPIPSFREELEARTGQKGVLLPSTEAISQVEEDLTKPSKNGSTGKQIVRGFTEEELEAISKESSEHGNKTKKKRKKKKKPKKVKQKPQEELLDEKSEIAKQKKERKRAQKLEMQEKKRLEELAKAEQLRKEKEEYDRMCEIAAKSLEEEELRAQEALLAQFEAKKLEKESAKKQAASKREALKAAGGQPPSVKHASASANNSSSRAAAHDLKKDQQAKPKRLEQEAKRVSSASRKLSQQPAPLPPKVNSRMQPSHLDSSRPTAQPAPRAKDHRSQARKPVKGWGVSVNGNQSTNSSTNAVHNNMQKPTAVTHLTSSPQLLEPTSQLHIRPPSRSDSKIPDLPPSMTSPFAVGASPHGPESQSFSGPVAATGNAWESSFTPPPQGSTPPVLNSYGVDGTWLEGSSFAAGTPWSEDYRSTGHVPPVTAEELNVGLSPPPGLASTAQDCAATPEPALVSPSSSIPLDKLPSIDLGFLGNIGPSAPSAAVDNQPLPLSSFSSWSGDTASSIMFGNTAQVSTNWGVSLTGLNSEGQQGWPQASPPAFQHPMDSGTEEGTEDVRGQVWRSKQSTW